MKKFYLVCAITVACMVFLTACSTSTNFIPENNHITEEEFYNAKTDTFSEDTEQAIKVASLKKTIRDCLNANVIQDLVRITENEAVYYGETQDYFFKIKFLEIENLEEYFEASEEDYKVTYVQIEQTPYLKIDVNPEQE